MTASVNDVFVFQFGDNFVDLKAEKEGKDGVEEQLSAITFDGITIAEILKVTYDFDKVQKVKTFDTEQIKSLKSKLRGLAISMKDDSIFTTSMEECLTQIDSNAKSVKFPRVFKNIVFTRYFLYKFCLTAFISLTIYDEVKSEQTKIANKYEKLQSLKRLLKETTYILLNLDIIPNNVINATNNTSTDLQRENSINLPLPPFSHPLPNANVKNVENTNVNVSV